MSLRIFRVQDGDGNFRAAGFRVSKKGKLWIGLGPFKNAITNYVTGTLRQYRHVEVFENGQSRYKYVREEKPIPDDLVVIEYELVEVKRTTLKEFVGE